MKRNQAALTVQTSVRMHLRRYRLLRVTARRKNLLRPIISSWRRVVIAQIKSRHTCIRTAFHGWKGESNASKDAVRRFAVLLQRAVGSSPATAYWRLVLSEWRRRPRPTSVPTVFQALQHCRTLTLVRALVHGWQQLVKKQVWC